MERTVTCPKCGKAMRVRIWSETLTQVLKCANCGHTFTYDPSTDRQQEKVPEKTRASRSEGLSVSEILEKGLRMGKEMTASPVNRAKRELKEILSPEGTGTGKGDEKKELPTREVKCPYCGREFRAALPDNDRPVLTTKCPDCKKVFTFLREVPGKGKGEKEKGKEKRESDEEKEEKKAEEREKEGKGSVSEKIPGSRGNGIKTGKTEEKTGEEADWDSIIMLNEDRGEEEEEPSEKKMIKVVCPVCGESFETVLPDKRGKVSCPICEHKFEINSRGEYIAKKAGKNPVVEEAVAVKNRLKREAEEGIKDIKNGLDILRDPVVLKKRLRLYSGIAGLLLLIVSIIGLAYSGALILSLHELQDSKSSGTASVSGEVLCGDDTIEGADVNLTDMGLHTTTDGEGIFRFEDVPTGDHTIEVSAPGKGTLTVMFNIGNSAIKRKNLDIVLEVPENGTATKDMRTHTSDNAGLVNGLMVGFVVLISLLTFYAALLSLNAKRFRRTLFLSGVGTLTFGFLMGSALAIAAMILVILGRKEFEKGK